MCEFAALGALCAPGATIQILQLHLGSYAKLAAILNELPTTLGNVFKVINTAPLYHICIATAESPFFLFSKSMPVAQIKKWDVAFGALLVALGYLTATSAPCTIFQTLLDVHSPENKAARLVFAAAARVRGLLQVQNGTGLWNVFHPILVAAGVINWGELSVKNSTGIFNTFHAMLVSAGVTNWGDYSYIMKTGIHDPKNKAIVRAGSQKGREMKKGEGQHGKKNLGKVSSRPFCPCDSIFVRLTFPSMF